MGFITNLLNSASLEVLYENIALLFQGNGWQRVVMWIIGGLLIYLAIAKDMEPTLLLPMGFGTIIVNIPFAYSGALSTLFAAGISNELFPLILFIGIGAMIDFGPLLSNPKLIFFGAAAQIGIFIVIILACVFGFELKSFPKTKSKLAQFKVTDTVNITRYISIKK